MTSMRHTSKKIERLPGQGQPDRYMSAETVNNRAKLIMHRLASRVLRKESTIVDQVRMGMEHPSERTASYVQEWVDLLNLEPSELARKLTERSEQMTRLRLTSPFTTTLDFSDPDFRRRVWRKARLIAA